MFEKLEAPPDDPIIKLLELYRADPRPSKIDVGIGVFKDANGNTPVMQAVRVAEARLHEQQTTKAYVGLAGDPSFNQAMIDLAFGKDSALKARVRGVQATGGSAAVRLLADVLCQIDRERVIWVSDPTWGNHQPVFRQAGLQIRQYPYFSRETRQVKEDEFLDFLGQRGPRDIVLFHGCCHNPTGADLSHELWDEAARLCAKNGFFPFIDLAYQGFGDGLEKDAYGVRKMAASVEEMVLASSCSKNFGLYRDRAGCAMVMAATPKVADIARGHVLRAARTSYSMPPDHGGAIVGIIMNDSELRRTWQEELSAMRNRMLHLRSELAGALRRKTGSDRWDFIAGHRGMFSLLSLTDAQVDALMKDHAVYVVGGGRINVAGLKDEDQVERFAEALVAVTRP